ncbi:MAG: hypothetical protein IJ719_17620 [Clostridia bacterium]|nr:hypothetical protein [Clostridia bacterium]
MYTIFDTVSNSPIFNVLASDGREALMKFMAVRQLRADYEIRNEDGQWILMNSWGSKFVAVEFENGMVI